VSERKLLVGNATQIESRNGAFDLHLSKSKLKGSVLDQLAEVCNAQLKELKDEGIRRAGGVFVVTTAATPFVGSPPHPWRGNPIVRWGFRTLPSCLVSQQLQLAQLNWTSMDCISIMKLFD
jgi:hypothetical protein